MQKLENNFLYNIPVLPEICCNQELQQNLGLIAFSF